MKTEIKKLPKSKIEILFEIPAEEFDKFREKAVLNLGKDLEIEGFRKSKIPKEIVERKIGQEKILKETVKLAIKENYLRIILENRIEALGQPEIKILKLPAPHRIYSGAGASGNPLILKAQVSVMPEVNLPAGKGYKEIASEVKRNKISVEEKEVEDAISWLQKSRAKFTLKNQSAQIGDFVEIEFQSPQIEAGLKRKDGFILGQGHLIPGFEENLIGMVNGQEKEFSLKFPESHFQKDLAGNLINFKVKMNSVQKIELPEINDEWAKNLGRFENLASLKESVREGINLEKEREESQRVRQEILEKISQKAEIEIPEILIEEEKNKLLENLKKSVSEILKISFEDYLKKIKKSEEELRESFSEEAKRRIKNSLILREIARKEKIEVSEEEIKNEINRILKKYPFEKAKELDLGKLKLYIEGEIRNEKTLQRLESLAK